MNRLLTKECQTCGKSFGVYLSRIKKTKNSGNYCSISCSLVGTTRAKGHKVSQEAREKISKNTPKYSGAKHWNWKGGISAINDLLRKSLSYKNWRDSVYKRDRWTCRVCKEHCQKSNIVAHHIKEFSSYPELRYEVDNGVTLCRKCHINIHKPNLHLNHALNPN